ncbi:MAG: acetylornithine deacetylase [Alphaproteobacteria bacterium]|nr:acetylornithine deacetylase [Alphaproteobacteria bacterium]
MPAHPTVEAILAALVAFDTTSSASNTALIAWIEEYLAPYAAQVTRVNETNAHGITKSALLARIGPQVEGGIVLSGHTDVVPVIDQQWTGGVGAETAFTLTCRDDRFYGRGTADMKGFIALALAQAPVWATQELQRPVWLALSYDEEVGCKCAEPLAVEFTQRTIRPQLIMVGEPTMMQVVDEHKGIDAFETIITGKEGHSSAPDAGVNAAYIAAHLTVCLEEMNLQQQAQAVGGSAFPTPYSTVHVGVMQAGVARNIIAGSAAIRWEVRPMPGADVNAIIAPFEACVAALITRYPGCAIETRRLTHVQGLKKQNGDAAYLALAMYLAGSNGAPGAVSYGTEGGAFGAHGFPTVICGPGSIDQAHQPDEYIAKVQLEKGAAMMQRVGEVLARGGRGAGRQGSREAG